METEIVKKLFLLQNIEDYLIRIGVSVGMSNFLTLIVCIASLVLLVVIIDKIGGKVLGKFARLTITKTKTKLDDQLLRRKFFTRIFKLLTASILSALLGRVFMGFNPAILNGAEILLNIYITLLIVLSINSLLEVMNDMYRIKSRSNRKSIKGYIQAVQILVAIIGGIIIISFLFQKDISKLMTGLAASAAVVTLVFKDTILGFIASIQISTQDLIRLGDWIEVPAKNANGVVTDMNLTSVKVRNWDNTVTSMPIYALVSDAFTNWRNMEESSGRRIKRHLLLDLNSAKVLSPEEIETILVMPHVSRYSTEIRSLLNLFNTSGFNTNLGLYRCYLEVFLKNHPRVNHENITLVRYINPNENGVTFELYCFSKEKNMVEYERIIADIIENAVIMAPVFEVRLYQRPLDKPNMGIGSDESRNVEPSGDFSNNNNDAYNGNNKG